jgi:DNA polymerase-3 subunit delta
MIIRQFRLLLLTKEHLNSRGGMDTLPDVLGVKSKFAVEKFAKQSRAFSLAELEAIYRKLLDYDVQMKTGRIKPELALDLFFAGMAR